VDYSLSHALLRSNNQESAEVTGKATAVPLPPTTTEDIDIFFFTAFLIDARRPERRNG
jgi:hypothetical protein